jgi:hypothetical protein
MPVEEGMEVHELCDLLVKECGRLGLNADRTSPTRIRIGATGAGMLAEVIRCHPDADEVLQWWWSWGEPFCPATASEIGRAAAMVKHVVTPSPA